jgi:hypothetical protein
MTAEMAHLHISGTGVRLAYHALFYFSSAPFFSLRLGRRCQFDFLLALLSRTPGCLGIKRLGVRHGSPPLFFLVELGSSAN